MARTFLYYSQLNTGDRLKALLLVLGLLSLTSCQSLPTKAEPSNSASVSRTLTVSGKGDVSIPTTITSVRLGVEIQGKTAQDVQKQVAVRSQAVVDLLKSRQVQALQTTGISLNPNYIYQNGKQSINSYTGTNIVSFRIDTDKSGIILDDAIKSGATRIDGISFIASDQAIALAQQQAIQKATADANQKADAALKALNLRQKEIISVQINLANPPQPINYSSDALSAKVAQTANTAIVSGEQKVEQFVTLQIRY